MFLCKLFCFKYTSFEHVSVTVLKLLPRLHDIANQAVSSNSAVSKKLKDISEDLKNVLEKQMQVRIVGISSIQ